MIKPTITEFTIVSRRTVAENTSEVTLDTGGKEFTFFPGQYIRLTIPSLSPEVPKGNTRDFTIASSPNSKTSLSIVFRNSDSPFKKELLTASVGTKVQAQGPLGVFALPEDESVPIVFVAGGVGITPVLSMIRYVAENKTNHQITIFYANASLERAVFIDEIRSIVEKVPAIKLVEKIGEVDLEFISDNTNISSFSDDTLWYLCGVPEMTMVLSKEIPKVLGVPERNIRVEEYVGYKKNNSEYKVYPPVSKNVVELVEENVEANILVTKALLAATGQSALIAITDAQGTILYINEKFLEVAKYSKEEVIGQNHRILKSGIHSPKFYEDLWKTISAGKLWRGELKNRAKDGSFYWVDTSITPIFKEDGTIDKYLAVRFLITDKKELEEVKKVTLGLLNDINASSSRLALATESAKIGVWDYDVVNNVINWDEQMYKLYGIKKEDFGGAYEAWQSGLHPDDKKPGDEAIQLALKGEKEFDTSFRVVWPSGEIRFIKAYALVERDAEGKPLKMVGVNWDITHEKMVDQAKTEFVSLASHQLRTPLSAINWFAEMLVAGDAGELNEDQLVFAQQILDSNARMVALVDSLLNVSRIDLGTFAIEPEKVSLQKISDSVLAELTPKIEEKKQIITKNYDEEVPEIMADTKLTRIILQNLISNAVKYTGDEGKITVSITKDDTFVQIMVADTGYGIPKAQQGRIFEKLFRADNVREMETDGTGLGLYIIKAVAEEVGGKAWFESEEGIGTSFYVTIPLSGMKKKDGNKELD